MIVNELYGASSSKSSDQFRIAECVISRQEFFANQMYEAMRGLGTDDDRLIRNIVARCEVSCNHTLFLSH